MVSGDRTLRTDGGTSTSGTDRRKKWGHGLTGEFVPGRGPITQQRLHLRDGDSNRPVCESVLGITDVGYDSLEDRQRGYRPEEAWPPACRSCLNRSVHTGSDQEVEGQ